MPVLETDFLKGLIDPDDELHEASKKSLEKVKKGKWMVASSAFLELDLVLKSEEVQPSERRNLLEALESEIPREAIVTLTPSALAEATEIRENYQDLSHFYFDSIHLGIACMVDRRIVSSDSDFNKIGGVERIPLERV